MTVMSKAIEHSGRHFCITVDASPFAEAEICCDNDAECGHNKLILTCNGENGVSLYALWDAQSHDDELQ